MELVLLAGQVLLKYGPDIAEEFTTLFHKGTPPTPDEWGAFFALVRKSGQSYFDPPAAGGAVPLVQP